MPLCHICKFTEGIQRDFDATEHRKEIKALLYIRVIPRNSYIQKITILWDVRQDIVKMLTFALRMEKSQIQNLLRGNRRSQNRTRVLDLPVSWMFQCTSK